MMTKKACGFLAKHHLTRVCRRFLEYLESTLTAPSLWLFFQERILCITNIGDNDPCINSPQGKQSMVIT